MFKVNLCFVVFTLVINYSEQFNRRQTNNGTGLFFYDLKTNKPLSTPIVTLGNSSTHSLGRLPSFGMPCACQTLNCGCCAGLSFQQFNNHMCTNFTYDPYDFSVTMDVMMNENNIYTNSFSARNPPPLCVPVPVPYIPIRIEMCAQAFNVFMPGNNIHMCLDMMARIQQAPILVLHFDCMRMGQDGFTFLKPEDGGGNVDGGWETENNSNGVDGLGETDQENPDVYDEVTEV